MVLVQPLRPPPASAARWPVIVRHALPAGHALRGGVLVPGNFDGFHLGHRALLREARAREPASPRPGPAPRSWSGSPRTAPFFPPVIAILLWAFLLSDLTAVIVALPPRLSRSAALRPCGRMLPAARVAELVLAVIFSPGSERRLACAGRECPGERGRWPIFCPFPKCLADGSDWFSGGQSSGIRAGCLTCQAGGRRKSAQGVRGRFSDSESRPGMRQRSSAGPGGDGARSRLRLQIFFRPQQA
ncbi:hypothetical protein XINFAN_02132 [Pseudogemmobacter humi]|uniref:Uncharacterized protein n=1 Tax=Pseudogemmobacter humi TaxID=2483812 RepID=A0A3P5X2R7_9RHOB|nr:hypothetical protein [Pseudogemmobacter humi]VDC28483.1 hypothetical protein XINFAN_02132 [Pseudogemmobacter humi]